MTEEEEAAIYARAEREGSGRGRQRRCRPNRRARRSARFASAMAGTAAQSSCWPKG
jgi:hypothetical protein